MDVLAACRDPDFWSIAFDRETIARALRVAAIVGTVLILINQGDGLLRGQIPPIWKILLTYCVPYSVSTYSVASAQLAARKLVQQQSSDKG